MSSDLVELVKYQEKIKDKILALETKDFFIIAFRKIINSKDFNRYMNLKKDLLTANSDEKQIIINKIIKLETYGSVSDYIYLLNNCDDVKKYLNLKIKLFEIERQITNIDFEEDTKNVENKTAMKKFLTDNYIEKKAKTLVK